MNSSIKDFLQSVEISNAFSKDHLHGIKTSDEWDVFEPTRFVYAFFAFNMLYEVDWESTMESGHLRYLQAKKIRYAKDQIKELIEFIFRNDPEAFERALVTFDPERKIYDSVKHFYPDKNTEGKSKLNNSLTISRAFLGSAQKFSNEETLTVDDWFYLLEMSYAVRNNLFHGEKKANKMKEQGHRERLMHYGNILLATNEAFFEVVRSDFGYRRTENWEVNDNLFK